MKSPSRKAQGSLSAQPLPPCCGQGGSHHGTARLQQAGGGREGAQGCPAPAGSRLRPPGRADPRHQWPREQQGTGRGGWPQDHHGTGTCGGAFSGFVQGSSQQQPPARSVALHILQDCCSAPTHTSPELAAQQRGSMLPPCHQPLGRGSPVQPSPAQSSPAPSSHPAGRPAGTPPGSRSCWRSPCSRRRGTAGTSPWQGCRRSDRRGPCTGRAPGASGRCHFGARGWR